jgi:hypothetical protein
LFNKLLVVLLVVDEEVEVEVVEVLGIEGLSCL